jgi:hypothetical protein
MLANFSNEELTIPKATILGVAEEVSEFLVDKINIPAEFKADNPTRPPRIKRNEAFYNKLLLGKLDHLTSEDRQHIEPILRKYAHVFHDEDTNNYKATHVKEHQIHVGDAILIRKHPYRTPFALRREMQDQLQETVTHVYARQIVTKHCTRSQLITDQGPAFMSLFFQETCKVLGIHRTRTTSYHPMPNGFSE